MAVLFAYWCATCRGWWDAGINDPDENKRLRKYHARSRDVPGTWHHPGQPRCPVCGALAKSHLPTEFGSTRHHRFLTSEIVKSVGSGLEQGSEDI